MAKAHVHAASSARKFGGVSNDYLAVHEFLDSSKAVIADNRHRALTHTAWFISQVLPRVFGRTIVNAEGKEVSVRDVGEQHVLEDFGMRFVPTPQDYVQGMPMEPWMNGGAFGSPPSCDALYEGKREPVTYRIAD